MSEDEMIYKLWRLLDQIDTLDDYCKDDDAAFRASVRLGIRGRYFVCKESYVDALYAKYYQQQP